MVRGPEGDDRRPGREVGPRDLAPDRGHQRQESDGKRIAEAAPAACVLPDTHGPILLQLDRLDRKDGFSSPLWR